MGWGDLIHTCINQTMYLDVLLAVSALCTVSQSLDIFIAQHHPSTHHHPLPDNKILKHSTSISVVLLLLSNIYCHNSCYVASYQSYIYILPLKSYRKISENSDFFWLFTLRRIRGPKNENFML